MSESSSGREKIGLGRRIAAALVALFLSVAGAVSVPSPVAADTSLLPGAWSGIGEVGDWEQLGPTPEGAVLLGSAAVGDWLYFIGGAEYIGAGNSANILACAEAQGVSTFDTGGGDPTLPESCEYLDVSLVSFNGYAAFQVPIEAVGKKIGLYRGEDMFQGPKTDVVRPRRTTHTPEPIAELPPKITAAQSGVVYESQEAQLNSGVWQVDSRTYGPVITVYRCATAGDALISAVAPAGCKRVGRTSDQYTVRGADRGKYLRISVMAWNRIGTGLAWSATLAVSAAGPNIGRAPENLVAPWIGAATEIGGIIPADPGDWLETDNQDDTYAPISEYRFSWQRCSAAESAGALQGASCEAVSSQNRCVYGCDSGENTYEVTRDDVGYRLRFGVTAISAAGKTTLYTATTDPVPEPPLEAPSALDVTWLERTNPSYWGFTAAYGGGWDGYPAPALAEGNWYRCSGAYGDGVAEAPSECSIINDRPISVVCSSDSCASDFSTMAADVGYRIRFCVTATNQIGSGSTCSATSDVVPNLTPTNAGGRFAPQLLGFTSPGVSIRASTGTWLGAPPETYSYKWYNCTTGGSNTPVTVPAGCTVITRATAASYTPGRTQAGKYLRVRVTVKTSWGGVPLSASIFSAAAGPIQAPPKSLTAPQITGTMFSASTLSVSSGNWSGLPNLSIAWWRCSSRDATTPVATPAGCTRIAGAIASTYVLRSDDIGFSIRASIIGTNSGGAAVRFSAATAQVQVQP